MKNTDRYLVVSVLIASMPASLLSEIPPVPATKVVINREIWIGWRRDAQPGTGKIDDPFDASTQAKFDKLMNRARPGTHIHILPGEYETKGDQGWQPKDNQWIQGAGMGSTVLRRVGITGREAGQPAVIGGGDGSQRYHIRISDLTLDCNGSAIPPKSISRALGLSCVYAKIENVEAKNFGHYQSGAEMFGFGVTSTAPGKHWVEIRNCYFHSYISRPNEFKVEGGNPLKLQINGNVVQQYPKGVQAVFFQPPGQPTNNGKAVALNVKSSQYSRGNTTLTFSQPAGTKWTAGLISPSRAATVIFAVGTHRATWQGALSSNYIYMPSEIPTAFGAAGWDGIVVENNTVYAGSLFTFDTYNSATTTFVNNVMHAGTPAGSYIGVVGGGYHWKNWRIEGNQFYMQPVVNQGIMINRNVDHVDIVNNWFFPEAQSNLTDVLLINLHGSNINLTGNRFDRALAPRFFGRPSVAVDNTYLDGTIVSDIEGNVLSRSGSDR